MLKKLDRSQIALSIVLLGATAIRIWNFPAPYFVRDVDEAGYLSGGLLMWEGITPGYKMAPSGPITWIGWLYSACLSIKNFLLPTETERLLPTAIRPFTAIERTLFDTYRDMAPLREGVVVLIVLISLCGIWAAFRIGHFRAGVPGGIAAGGLMAVLPIFVRHSGMISPYIVAWSFGAIAYYFAVTHIGRWRWLGSAIFMALSIGSRIDMVTLIPLFYWEFWQSRETPYPVRQILKFSAATIVATLLVSPWLLTNLVGNLRSIATIRFSGPKIEDTWLDTLLYFVWYEGLGPATLLTIVGFALCPKENRFRYWTVAAFMGVLLLTIFKYTGYGLQGLRHQGAVLVAFIVILPLALQCILRFGEQIALFFVCLILILPCFQAINSAAADKATYVPDSSVAWIDRHVPTGTTIYLTPTFHDPLPTEQSSDNLWGEVNNKTAWQKKLQSGIDRFKLPTKIMPRALSEENLIMERSMRRRWFILGGRPQLQVSRFNIRIFDASPVFGIDDDKLLGEFRKTGGILIWKGYAMSNLGKPIVSWTNSTGRGTYLYASPDVKASLN